MTISLSPEATASSTTYWIVGLSTSGSISFGCAFVAGRKRVPRREGGDEGGRGRRKADGGGAADKDAARERQRDPPRRVVELQHGAKAIEDTAKHGFIVPRLAPGPPRRAPRDRRRRRP